MVENEIKFAKNKVKLKMGTYQLTEHQGLERGAACRWVLTELAMLCISDDDDDDDDQKCSKLFQY